MAGAAGARGDIYVQDVERGTADGGCYALDFKERVILSIGGEIGVGHGLVDEESKSPASVAGTVLSYKGVIGEGGRDGICVQFSFLQRGNLDLVAAEETLQLHPGGLDSPRVPLDEGVIIRLAVRRSPAAAGWGRARNWGGSSSGLVLRRWSGWSCRLLWPRRSGDGGRGRRGQGLGAWAGAALTPPARVEKSGLPEVCAFEMVGSSAEWAGYGGVGSWWRESSGDRLIALGAFGCWVLT